MASYLYQINVLPNHKPSKATSFRRVFPTLRTRKRANPHHTSGPVPHPICRPRLRFVPAGSSRSNRCSSSSQHEESPESLVVSSKAVLDRLSVNLVRQSFQARHRKKRLSQFVDPALLSVFIPISFNGLEMAQSTQTGHLEAAFCTYESVPFCPSN